MPRKQRFKPTRKPRPGTAPEVGPQDDALEASSDPQIAEVAERLRRYDVIG